MAMVEDLAADTMEVSVEALAAATVEATAEDSDQDLPSATTFPSEANLWEKSK